MQNRTQMKKNIILLAIGMAFVCFCFAVPSKASDTDLSALVEPGEPESIATGLGFADGPVWHPDGYLLFCDGAGSTIYKWTPDGKLEKFRSPSSKSIALTFDQQGRLVACEHGNRRVSRTEKDGAVVTLADRYEGKRLNSPNDVVVKSDGSIYFTDPPHGLRMYAYDIAIAEPREKELGFDGVYRLSPDGKTLSLLVSDLEKPNGLAFSPDEKVLYVTYSERQEIRAFDVKPDGTLVNGRVFANTNTQEDLAFPDGLKVDINGNLYVASNTNGISVYDKTGKHLGTIFTNERTVNCAFGGPENKTLFITALTSVYRVRLKVPGIKVMGK
jgi:gluconolactonase